MNLLVKVGGEERPVPTFVASQMLGPRPPHGFECDGCSYSPDYLFGVPLWIACVWHDVPYPNFFRYLGVTRSQVDFWLYRNMYKVVMIYSKLYGWNPWARKPVAIGVSLVYGTIVNALGGVSGWRRWARAAILLAVVFAMASTLFLGIKEVFF